MLDLCVDYVGRDGVADMEELAGRFATASTLPIVLDSTEVPVLRAGLEKLGGRAVINSVNYEDGDGPESRFAKVTAAGPRARRRADRADHRRGGPGPHRRAQGRHRRAAHRRPDRQLGHPRVRHPHRHPDLHHLHRPGGVPQGRHRHHRGDPRAQAPPPGRADHAGPVEHLLRPQPGRPRRAQLGLPGRVRQGRPGLGDRARLARSCRSPGSTRSRSDRPRPGLRPPREGYDPLQKLMALFEGVDTKSLKAGRAEELLALPLDERLQRRIIDGEKNGLEADLDEALQTRPALEIVNDTLLDGMKVVGELFGSGQMQLPFVLQSAEVMKTAVAYLEPHMEKSRRRGQGHHRAGHRPRRRPRHRQEPRRHHPVQQRLQRRQPRHQAAGLRDPGGRRRSTGPTSSACPGCW